MNDSNKIIEEYISKLFEVQRARENQPLTEQELKEIALDAGMSEEDWQAAQEVYLDHIERAEGFLKYKNWSDAIQEYKQALRIKPNDTQALASIAYAYKMRWQEKSQNEDRDHALVFARQCLQASPQNSQALIIVSELSKEKIATKTSQVSSSSQRTILIIVAASIILLLAAIIFVQTGADQDEYRENQDYTLPNLSQEPTTNTPDALPQGMQFEVSSNTRLSVKELASEFKKLFGNRTSHHANCSFENTGENAIKRLKIEVTWFDNKGTRIIQRDFNIVPENGKPLAPGHAKEYTIKQSFPQGKTQENFRYYLIKIRKIQ
ncbi:hypothetical protein BKI52_07645 [marine bacterium AO1-C]|nr:hypothetical protein BKI52_07645 [marine bacterium AO1-C]